MDHNLNGDCSVAAAPPKKKSLFSRSAIAKQSAATEAVDFFSRAKDFYPQQLAEEERKRRKKLVKIERKRSSTGAEVKESISPAEKRRKVSAQEPEQQDHHSDKAVEPDSQDEWSDTEGQSRHSLDAVQSRRFRGLLERPVVSSTLLGRDTRQLHAKHLNTTDGKVDSKVKGHITVSETQSERESLVREASHRGREGAEKPIFLEDDSDDAFAIVQSRTKPPISIEDDHMSDEEFPELIQAARERAREKALQKESAIKTFSERNHMTGNTGQGLGDDDDLFDAIETVPETDPTVDILITSIMEDTKPIRVKRKISQQLREARIAWCDKQNIDGQPMPQDFKDTIFLTWKRTRVYDATTCKSLIPKTETYNLGATEFRLHLDAWTEEAWKTHQEKEAAQQLGGLDQSDGESTAIQSAPVPKIKLIMKSKDMEPFKLQVKSTTVIKRMVAAFRSSKEVPEEKEIVLYFDGDKLDQEWRIGDTDLADMDTVEVHFR